MVVVVVVVVVVRADSGTSLYMVDLSGDLISILWNW